MSYGMFSVERLSGSSWIGLPCESALLRLVSLSEDTLTLGGMNFGLLSVRTRVRVNSDEGIVFSGTCSTISNDTRRGRTQRQTATIVGTWHTLGRTTFTQPWMMWVSGEAGSSWQLKSTGRVCLNQDEAGYGIGIRDQLAQILSCLPSTRVATDAQSLSAIPDMMIPYDEARDLSCAQAVQKELRFMPRAASRFDYTASVPLIRFLCPGPSDQDADWISDYTAAGRLAVLSESETDDPPTGVQIEIETGEDRRNIALQEAGDTSDPSSVLRACLSLAGRVAEANWQYLDVVTEPAPSTSAEGKVNFTDTAAAQWLIAHCACLKGLLVSEVHAGAIARSGEADKGQYPRITSTPIKDLDRAGIKARVETFTANVNVSIVSDDGTSARTEIKKMRIVLSLITTNAETKRYKWADSWHSEEGETAPDDLAEKLLGHLSDCGRSSVLSIRLQDGLGIPRPGDCRSGLPCQSVAIDLKRETAVATFGAPSHLSAADLASVISGFRNMRRASVWGSKRSAGDDDDDAAEPSTIVCPVKEESFSLGSYSRIGASADGKKADVNPSDLTASGSVAKFRTVNFKGKDGSTKNFQVLSTEPKDGEADEADEAASTDPCEDHPEGGDGVDAGDGNGAGGGELTDYGLGGQGSGGGGDGGVTAEGADDEGSADGCTTQCEC